MRGALLFFSSWLLGALKVNRFVRRLCVVSYVCVRFCLLSFVLRCCTAT